MTQLIESRPSQESSPCGVAFVAYTTKHDAPKKATVVTCTRERGHSGWHTDLALLIGWGSHLGNRPEES